MEFGGTDSYTLDNNITHYNNLTITGSGIKTLPNKDITICGDLRIEEEVTLTQPGVSSGYRYTNIHGNVFLLNHAVWKMNINVWISLRGDFVKDNFAFFDGSYNRHFFHLNGDQIQSLYGDYSGTNRFNHLYISNPHIIRLNGPIDIRNYLYLIHGRVQNSSSSLITLTLNAGNGLISVHNGFIEGPIRINMRNSTLNKFLPVGKNNIRKFIHLPDITDPVAFWEGEYFNTSPSNEGMDHTAVAAPLLSVSQSEYWLIQGPLDVSTKIMLTLDGTSDIAAALDLTGDLENLRLVRWSGTQWEIVGGELDIVGTITNGEIITTDEVTFNGNEQYFTLGAVHEVDIPTARIISEDATICENGDYGLIITLTGTQNWEVDYTINGGSIQTMTATESPLSISFTNLTETSIFELQGVRYEDTTPGIIYGSSVTASIIPNPFTHNVGGGGDICGIQTTEITLDESQNGYTYQLFRETSLVSEQPGTGSAISFSPISNEGTYTIEAFYTGSPQCIITMSGNAIVSIVDGPTAEITSVDKIDPICEGDAIILYFEVFAAEEFEMTITESLSGIPLRLIKITDQDMTGAGPIFEYSIIPAEGTITWIDMPPAVFTYAIQSFSDNSGCPASFEGEVSVDVFKIPETGPQYHIPNVFEQ